MDVSGSGEYNSQLARDVFREKGLSTFLLLVGRDVDVIA